MLSTSDNERSDLLFAGLKKTDFAKYIAPKKSPTAQLAESQSMLKRDSKLTGDFIWISLNEKDF